MVKRALWKLRNLMVSAEKRYYISKYSSYGPGHVFDIRVDDLALKMTFLDKSIGNAIVERIEGRREPYTVTAIRALVRPGSKVLEIGACYGYFTFIISSCAGPEGKVVSIEGTPNNYKILQRNIELNKLSNVVASNCFVTDKADEVTFGLDEHDPYGAISRLGAENKDRVLSGKAVRAVRLSEFLNEIQFQPDYMFMDIEGFEIDVFKDLARGYLAKTRPVIVFEIHKHFYKGQENLDFIKAILEKNNYYYREDSGNLLCFPN